MLRDPGHHIDECLSSQEVNLSRELEECAVNYKVTATITRRHGAIKGLLGFFRQINHGGPGLTSS